MCIGQLSRDISLGATTTWLVATNQVASITGFPVKTFYKRNHALPQWIASLFVPDSQSKRVVCSNRVKG